MKKEKELSKIYHPFWKTFSKNQYNSSVSLFAGRLSVNRFDIDWFKGKVCLDAGCGSGRYIEAMLELGAKEVVGIDLNPKIAKSKVKSPKARVMKGDIRKIPFNHNYFDFICCNGVLHHISSPEKVLKEFNRVLKPGGIIFLYVFDWYSDDWKVIDEFRKVCKKFPVQRVRKFIKSYLNSPETKLFAFCDVLYAPIQRKFKRQELRKMLKGYNVHFFKVPFTDYDSAKENRLIAIKN